MIAPPRVCSVPPCSSSLGREAVDLASSAGLVLDDWQAFILEQSLGLRDNGRWAAFEVGVNVPRQNGKNVIALARELVGLFLLNDDLLIHSAHEWKTSVEHQRQIERIIQDTPEFHKRIKPRGYKHAHGEESIELRTGQRIRFFTRTKGGGRGHTGDTVVLDEAMILPAAMLGALMPTMSARSVKGNPQLWYFFTAVDQLTMPDGIAAGRLRTRGLKGDDPSLAYFEWSYAADGPWAVTEIEATDPEVWRQANPALNIRISEEHVANEQRSMDPRTFSVERLGVGDWPALDGSVSVIPKILWDSLADSKSVVLDPVAFAFDVAPDRSTGAICVAGGRQDSAHHVEVVQHGRGTGWIVPRIVELVEKHVPVGVFCDASGPAAALLPALEAGGVVVTPLKAPEHAQACGILFDMVQQGQLRHLGTSELGLAVTGAVKRPLGEAWAWSRKNSSVDISPLVAATLALFGHLTQPGVPEPMFAFV